MKEKVMKRPERGSKKKIFFLTRDGGQGQEPLIHIRKWRERRILTDSHPSKWAIVSPLLDTITNLEKTKIEQLSSHRGRQSHKKEIKKSPSPTLKVCQMQQLRGRGSLAQDKDWLGGGIGIRISIVSS